jgi:hypothetical protein
VTVRTIDVERHADNDYTVRELTLRGPLAGPFVVVSSRTLAEHRSGNVARDDYTRPWVEDWAGRNQTGPFWR